MNENEAVQYLESLIGQMLRVHTRDTRIFVGSFKCTDAVSPSSLKYRLLEKQIDQLTDSGVII